MPLTAVPEQSAIPEFPALSDRALGTYNTKAYDWASRWRAVVAPQLYQFAQNTYANALFAHERAGQAETAANSAFDQAMLGLGYRNQAGNSATAAAQSASSANDSAFLAGQKRDQAVAAAGHANDDAQAVAAALGQIAGGPVVSINGLTGIVNLPVPGMADLGDVNLNTVVAPGFYRLGAAPVGGPAGVANAQLMVVRGGGAATTLTQMVFGTADNSMFVRSVSGVPGAPVASAWRRVAYHDDVVKALAGGAMDCAAANYFTETVNGARAFAFANLPTGAYACVLEIAFTSGSFTLPAGSVWVNGVVPTIATGKRHLLYFQRAQLGTAGWYVSALTGFAP